MKSKIADKSVPKKNVAHSRIFEFRAAESLDMSRQHKSQFHPR